MQEAISDIDDFETKRILYSNIILAGANTLYPNIEDRLYQEMDNFAPLSKMGKIIDRPNRDVSNWVGGAIRSRVANFDSMWMSCSEWQENGTETLERKFM